MPLAPPAPRCNCLTVPASTAGAGTIGDVTTPRTRGGYMGIFQAGAALGPVRSERCDAGVPKRTC
jgi:hypothetical protein